ncbi:MAG: GDP-mannose 4,6-dehydratase [Candidatus Tectimicrobiota bacterium]
MRILVTGGAGFIGSHLCERLLADHHEVAILDDLNDFYDPRLKEENLACIRCVGSVDFHQGDICDEALVQQLCKQFQPEAIIHLAARAGVRPSVAQPLLYERVNVGGTTILLEAARQYKVRKFIFASSSSVYGVTNQVPFREDDLELQPISPYAATKIAGEKLAFTYAYLFGLDVTCLRFFTVYGPRQRPDLAIRKFMTLMVAGQPIPFFGDGTTGRDYTFVSDTVQGIVAALQYHGGYDIFNLGNSSPVSLALMVQNLERALGQSAVLQHLPIPPGDVLITYADITKASTHLHYQPQVTFDDGIRRMAAWHAEHASRAGTAR